MIPGTSIEVDGRTVPVSNLDKPLFPDGFTKGRMLDYYLEVAAAMVPHLAGRPVTLRRFPDGMLGPTWFQTRCRGRPPWMRTAPVLIRRGEIHEYCLIEEAASLAWAANQAAVELHPFLADHRDPERPLVMVFDLDPGPPAGLAVACRVALRLRSLLEENGLRAFPKTSGSRGLHVIVPLNKPSTFERTKAFARTVAARMSREAPDTVVDRQERRAREGRVLIDWAQNDPMRSTAAPYSLRARRRPVVSAPVTWEEAAATAEGRLDLELTPDDILRRVNRLGDLFAPVLAVAQDLGVSRSRTAGKPEPMDEREQPGEDPTIEADRATPTEPGPGDSEGAKPESPPEEDGERKDE